jgi:cytosylglucuronate decarboxylase
MDASDSTNQGLVERPTYLFLRVLEACNAGCEMCAFAFSTDPYRLPHSRLVQILQVARREGMRYIRFTGGEPLVHAEIIPMIATVSAECMLSSIITNGALLARKLPDLVSAGLRQAIVSIDGACAETHDRIRATPGLFERAVEGLTLAKERGLRTRVNTVCGPNNFRELPRLQDLLTDLHIDQWELSSLKLERRLDYTSRDIQEVDEVIRYVYTDAVSSNRLLPTGKVWCGNSSEERDRYFASGITPRPDTRCHVVHRVRYLDAKRDWLFPCSLLPHRPEAQRVAETMSAETGITLSPSHMRNMVDWYYVNGPDVCTGCSTTAAGYSNMLHNRQLEGDWAY